jgi:hypothetical protein
MRIYSKLDIADACFRGENRRRIASPQSDVLHAKEASHG